MGPDEPNRISPGGALSRKMSSLARRDTLPEIELRQALHARGMRFRVQFPVPGNKRRRIDIAFTRVRLAVYVDGCFWHGCPEHGTQPVANADWWVWKIQRNQWRDRDTDEKLRHSGWTVLRVWEHEDVERAAVRVERAWRRLLKTR